MRLDRFDRSLFHPGDRVCCALSGGADSTALLLTLLEANREKESLGIVLSALHVHHGLRGAEADQDQAFVQALCTQHDVALEVVRVDTAARRASHGQGLEEAARDLRYAAFQDLLSRHHADSIATAHTADDQAETVVMKFLRGAWTEGLAGIFPVLHRDEAPATPSSRSPGATVPATQIVRPMLKVHRAEVERFLAERQQSWREDSSNQDTSLTRNRVRHELLPLLRSFNPAIVDNLGRTATLAREEEAFWQGEVARLLPGMVMIGRPVRGGGRAVSTAPGERTLALEIERLKPHPPALRRRLVRAAAATLGSRPGAEDTDRLLALAGLGEAPGVSPRNGARLELAGGLRAERSIRELRLTRAGALDIPKKM